MFGSKKQATATSGDTAKIDTLLGSSCTVNGDIITKTSLKIDGSVNGNVSADGVVVVAERGNIKGDVKCKELVVFGAIEGMINTENLHLQPSAKINGEINTQSLQVEAGAVYQGAVNMQSKAAAQNPKLNTVVGSKDAEKIKL